MRAHRLLGVGGVLVALVTVGGGVAWTAESGNDATRAYARATRAVLHETQREMPAIAVAMRRVVQNAVRTCPDVARAAPSTVTRLQVESDLTAILLAVAVRRIAPNLGALARVAQRVSWPSQHVTDAVRRAALAARRLAHEIPPEVCSVARLWATTGFAREPGVLTAFGKRVRASSEDGALRGVLLRYKRTDEVEAEERLGRTVARRLRSLVMSERKRLLQALGLIGPGSHRA